MTSRIDATAIDANIRLGSAGHLQRNSYPERLVPINRIGNYFRTSYVFQNDFFALFRRAEDLAVYDEGTGEVDAGAVRNIAKSSIGIDVSFESFFLFFEADRWRNFATIQHAYFGDRFHGGVIFLQTGRPALLVCNDARVAELTDFMSIPVVENEELGDGDPVEILKSKLCAQAMTRFWTRYLERLRVFRSSIVQVGLTLTNETDCNEALGEPDKLYNRA